MKLSKKRKITGWSLVAASFVGTFLTTIAFGVVQPAKSPGELVADFLTGILLGAGVYLWGKGDATKELGA